MCDNDEELLLLLAVLDEEETRERTWSHEINLTRDEKGEFSALFESLKKDPKRFFQYFRMSNEHFNDILNLIENDIKKEDTNYRNAISPTERLAITLRFLATGDSFKTIGFSFRVGFSTIGEIIKETSEAIWKNLQPIYMPEPNKEIWQNSEKMYREKWKFPNCIGSIDGKHVTIKCPKNTGSNYFSYLKKFSIVLLAIVDADYKFLRIDVGGYGKNSDSGIFEESIMGHRFEENLFDIPEEKCLPGQTVPTPHVLIGDEGFALKKYLMRPFPYRIARLDPMKQQYNTRLCTARRVVENAFGILSQKWRMFFRPLATSNDTTIKTIKAACILHNFLISKPSSENFHELSDSDEQQPALERFHNCQRRSTNEVIQLRQNFVEYFSTENE